MTLIITIPKSCRHDHDELRALITAGFVDAPDNVEVHVKSRARRMVWEAFSDGHTIRSNRRRDDGRTWHRVPALPEHPVLCSGRAYAGVPDIGRVSPRIRWLVTLTIPTPDAYATNTWPHEHVYPGKRDSSAPWPRAMFEGWRDDVLHTAAHEARHVHQFANGFSCSEMDAERYACFVLDRSRSTNQGETLCPESR